MRWLGILLAAVLALSAEAGTPQQRRILFGQGSPLLPIGRTWFTDFSNPAADATWGTATNLTYGTDGGSSAVSLTTPASIGSFYTNATDIQDFEILVKWRALAGSGFVIENIDVGGIGRYADASNFWWGRASLTGGNSALNGHSQKAGVYVSTGSAAVDNTDAATYRKIRMRVVGDAIFLKHWFVNVAEPVSWQIIERLRPPVGLAATVTATDNPEIGKAGFKAQFGGTIQELTVTEILPHPENLITSPNPTLLATGQAGDTSYPVGWYPTKGAGDTVDVVNTTDHFGAAAAVFHVNKVNVTVSTGWTQWLWEDGPNSFVTRLRPHPRVQFPSSIRVSLWTKGNNIALNGESFAASLITYQYAADGTILQTGGTNYFFLGPNGAGQGTWDWTLTTRVIPLSNPAATNSVRVDVFAGHGVACTGELWFGDVQMIPIQ